MDSGLTAGDLGLSQEAFDAGDQILPHEAPSSGRFPAGLAVVRVRANLDDSADAKGLHVAEIPQDQAAYWNQVMDTLPAVREVRLLREYGFDPRGAGSADFLAEAVKSDCSLCVVYGCVKAPVEGGAIGEIMGVLWDAGAMQPLIVIREPATVVLTDDDEADRDEQRRAVAAAYRDAECRLRERIRDVIWDLSAMDHPVAATQPNPWRHDDSISPRDGHLLRALDRLYRGTQE
jgi:hypothetical protein